jgi:protein-S-isoprenylcysteine O-methyltransferase Ste14
VSANAGVAPSSVAELAGVPTIRWFSEVWRLPLRVFPVLFDGRTTVRVLAMTGGLALHVLLLLAPLVVLGRVSMVVEEPAIVAFLLLASFFCGCDLTTLWHPSFPMSRAMSQSDERPARRLALATGVTLLVLFWVALVQRTLTPGGVSWPAAIAGSTLMLLGSLLRLASIRALGDGFRTEFTPVRSFVRRGVYRVCRHPSEAGLLSAALGACVLLSSAAAMILAVTCLLPLSLCRIHLEERRLLRTFGDDYRRYCRRVHRLLPFIY